MTRRPPKAPTSVLTQHIVGYVRVSTEEQAREGLSLEAQENRIRAYCAAQGLEVGEILTDAGGSGKHLQRPALQTVLARLRAGAVTAVVVTRLDRLTRRTRDLLALVEDDFKAYGVRLISLSEQLDTQTPAGMLMLTVLGALAQMERELIGERTREALAQKRARGDWLGGTPLGFASVVGGQLHGTVETELEAVRFIFQSRRAGKSYRAISRLLQEGGYETRRGGAWYDSTVRKVWARREAYSRLPLT